MQWLTHAIFYTNNLFLIIKECFANVESCFVPVLKPGKTPVGVGTSAVA